jgi:hypothetical protein
MFPRCIPVEREVVKFFKRSVIVERMMEAGENRAAAVGHLVAEELPVSIGVMGDVGYWFFCVLDGLR